LTEATEHLKERQNMKSKETLVTKNGKWGLTDLEKEDLAVWEKLSLDLPHCKGGGNLGLIFLKPIWWLSNSNPSFAQSFDTTIDTYSRSRW
jgi:hypothetical protein